MEQKINYEAKYKYIYISVCEYLLSQKNIKVCNEMALPIIKKIIRNYNRFKNNITDNRERRACDDYINSLKKMVEIVQKNLFSYELNRDCNLDIS